jgi:hypothetical protein
MPHTFRLNTHRKTASAGNYKKEYPKHVKSSVPTFALEIDENV